MIISLLYHLELKFSCKFGKILEILCKIKRVEDTTHNTTHMHVLNNTLMTKQKIQDCLDMH